MPFNAVVLRGVNDLQVEQVCPECVYLAPGQVVVKVEAAGICGAQLNEISGNKGPDPYLPHFLGHEGAGIVTEVGPGVRKVKPGDYVVLHWRKGSGIDADPPKYKSLLNGDVVGGGPVACWSEYAIISENRMTKISKEIPPEHACLLGCAVTTGVGLIVNEANVKPGQSVLIIGVGGVGLSAALGAKLVGAWPICCLDIKDEALRLAHAVSDSFCFLNYSDDMVSYFGGKEKFDVVVECTGADEWINLGLWITAPGGKLILVGQPPHGTDVTFTDFRRHYFGKTIMDSQGGLTNPDVDIPRYERLVLAGKMDLAPLVGSKIALSSVPDTVFGGLPVGRTVIDMGAE